MNLKYHLIVLSFLISVVSMPTQAGNIYRFLDKNGVSTLSKVLPPYAAQQGYDILDDKSYRLIERVLTLEESSKINEEKDRIARIKEEQDQIKLERLINDRSLLDRYPDDKVMIRARDTDLEFLKKQISEVTAHKLASTERLYNIQQQAAELELSGQDVSADVESQLIAAQQEIDYDQLHIERLQSEYTETEKQYEVDLARLRKLLNITIAPEVEISIDVSSASASETTVKE